MKKILPYILIIAGTSVLSGALIFGTMMFRPDLLKGSPTTVLSDSAAVAQSPKYLREYAGPTIDELTRTQHKVVDSIAVLNDSIRTLIARVQAEIDRADTIAKSIAQRDSAAQKSVAEKPVAGAVKAANTKTKAKMLEAMSAADAAKILSSLSDEETIELLQLIKARQAAKIVAAIQPERASRLFR
jgi:flagellar motility protein MotE (MotC chaperone)